MSFANPWMLLGALAALIPLLIHLFDRRRPRPHPFAAISFVLRSQRRTASRLRLKRLLLYALRTLILLALPVALARPEWKREASSAAAARGVAATAIVLDASLSMRFSDRGSLFERGRAAARDALGDLLPEEPATFLACSANPAPPVAPGFDRARLRAAVDEAQPTYGPADMTRCLELAARALEDNPAPGKRLVVVSDFTTGAFRLEVPPPTVQGLRGERLRPEVVLQDAARGREELPNRAVVDLKVEPALQAGPRAYQVSFSVRSFSSDPVKDLEAVLKVGDRVVAKGFLDLPAGGVAQKTFTHSFESAGTFAGEVAISPDALGEDDRRAFVVSVPKELRALVVNGAPSAVRYRDEAFFVEAALGAPGSPVRQAVRDAEAGLRESLEGYDAVLLLNVPAPGPEEAARLASFVQGGGGLFISVGDRVDPDAYNQRLGELLPRPLRLLKTAASRDEPDADSKAAHLSQVVQDHPVFSPFVGRALEGLMGARFYRYILLEAGASGSGAKAASSEVLATYEDGAPAVALAHRGKGRVLLFTSTVDRDWSDFAIRTSFLPLMQRFSAYLTGSLDEREAPRARVGETVVLRPEGQKQKELASVRAPSGAELELRRQPDGSVVTGPVVEPGLHPVLDAARQPIPALAFAADLDPSESDLTRLKPEVLAAYFGEEAVQATSHEGAQPAVPLWTWLIVAAVLAFFFEGVLLRS